MTKQEFCLLWHMWGFSSSRETGEKCERIWSKLAWGSGNPLSQEHPLWKWLLEGLWQLEAVRHLRVSCTIYVTQTTALWRRVFNWIEVICQKKLNWNLKEDAKILKQQRAISLSSPKSILGNCLMISFFKVQGNFFWSNQDKIHVPDRILSPIYSTQGCLLSGFYG